MSEPTCQFCGTRLELEFADLGVTPLANSFIPADARSQAERFYPLRAMVCRGCRLVQLTESERPEAIFRDYRYFSSYSESWLAHCERYAVAMAERERLGERSLVVEIGSNDGYLLRIFQRMGIPVLGVEPAQNVAEAARQRGVPTECRFFGERTARELADRGRRADLLAVKNVLAHVPDIRDFVAGIAAMLEPGGVATVEFPHLLEQILHNQFDTIYHEHYTYLSLLAVDRVFASCGMRVFDAEPVPTHGGSLRIFACHDDADRPNAQGADAVRAREREHGLDGDAVYERFASSVVETKLRLLRELIEMREVGVRVAGYGAPAKGNTLLNYCGVGREMIPYTVDRSPHKQGALLPGTRIPVHAPEMIDQDRPDVVLILPWNLRQEIQRQLAHIADWGGRFMVAIPTAEVWRPEPVS